MAADLGHAMGVVERVATLIARDGEASAGLVAADAGRLLAIEAPLQREMLVGEVVDRVLGLGPLQSLLDDPEVTDILVNGPNEIWIDRGSDLERVASSFTSVADLMAVVERTIAALGLRVDRSSPMVDGRLPDGSRIHVAIPPATVDHPVIAIRRFSPAVKDLATLVSRGTLSRPLSEFLQSSVAERKTIIVSGGTGAGKTTFLNVLAGEIPNHERLVTVEDAAELDFPGHVVRLEARPPNSEGYGEVTIRQLLRSALRLRPDRIILGEVRGPEALDLITALNTGHRGSMSTVHANSPEEAMWRLETLALLDGAASPDAIRRQLFAAVDLVIQMTRIADKRLVSAVCTLEAEGVLEEVDV
jgi:pilus assembly protein CpaF